MEGSLELSLCYFYLTPFQFVRLSGKCNMKCQDISKVNSQTDTVRKKKKSSISWTELYAQAGGIRYLVQIG